MFSNRVQDKIREMFSDKWVQDIDLCGVRAPNGVCVLPTGHEDMHENNRGEKLQFLKLKPVSDEIHQFNGA